MLFGNYVLAVVDGTDIGLLQFESTWRTRG